MQTTAKLFIVRVYQLITYQFTSSTEMLWRFTTNKYLHTFM